MGRAFEEPKETYQWIFEDKVVDREERSMNKDIVIKKKPHYVYICPQDLVRDLSLGCGREGARKGGREEKDIEN